MINTHFSSMGTQFLALGASSVLAANWPIEITEVETISGYFLDNWLRLRQPKAVALRESIKRIIQQQPDVCDVRRWGAITLLGDWL